MARIFMDGFESGGYDLYDSSHANAAVISSAGLDMNGSYCLDLTGNFAYIQKTITADDEIYAAFQWRSVAPSTLQPILLFYSGGTYLASLFRNNTTNVLYVYRGSTIIATGTESISNATTYLIEVYFKLADSGGRWTVKVDGVTDIDFTGDTKNDANTTFDGIRLGYYTSSFYAKAYFDNFVVDDSAWIDETFIQALVPTGIGNSSDWTASAGNNYACVDEIPASDADSVLSQAADDLDTYVTEDMAGNVEIKCVQIQTRCEITAGVSKNLKLVTRINATDYLSGDKAVPDTTKSLFNIWENNPDDAAAWERADVNGMEIGVKSGATINDITAYQMLAQVEWITSTAIDETSKIVNMTLTVSETDIQAYEDITTVTISTAVLVTDIQAYSDKLLLVVVLVTTSINNEFLGFEELSRLINLSLNISETDIQAYKDLQILVSLTSIPSVSDIQTYIETSLSILSTLTISVFDSVPFNDTDLLVSIISTVSETDDQGYSEILTIPFSLGITETDIQTYIDDTLILIGMSVELSDTIYEQMLISMAMSLTAIDGYEAISTRQAYELISREKSFELVGRTKTYYLTKE